jgi:hypothetical protein
MPSTIALPKGRLFGLRRIEPDAMRWPHPLGVCPNRGARAAEPPTAGTHGLLSKSGVSDPADMAPVDSGNTPGAPDADPCAGVNGPIKAPTRRSALRP